MKGSLWKKEGWEGPLKKNDLGDYTSEMTLIVAECHPRWINLKKFDKPSPLEGSYIKSHINHKGLTFEMFILLKKYCNNTSFGSLLTSLLILSIYISCSWFLLMHNACTQHKTQQSTITHTSTQDATKHNCAHSNTRRNKAWALKPKVMELKNIPYLTWK
jgi:hypothetical protein